MIKQIRKSKSHGVAEGILPIGHGRERPLHSFRICDPTAARSIDAGRAAIVHAVQDAACFAHLPGVDGSALGSDFIELSSSVNPYNYILRSESG